MSQLRTCGNQLITTLIFNMTVSNQLVLRTALESFPNESIKDLWKSNNNYTNIQYDGFKSTKEVLKDFRAGHEDKLKNQLSCQG